MRQLLAVDWGTSSLRGAWLAADGAVAEERAFPRGILSVPAGGFPAVFEECFGDWMQRPGALCLISGMAGSKQGWAEAAYCACPAGFADVASACRWIVPGRVAIVPGLSCEHDRTGLSFPDVMRGEEAQVFGALDLLGLQEGVLVLPGTHSKWVRVRAGRVEAFATVMTGEFYALLRQHSILARTLPATEGALNGEAFDAGVALALRSASMVQSAFSVRTLALFERRSGDWLASYLSGLVVGEELRSQQLAGVEQVIVIGSDALTERYARALAMQGVRALRAGSAATWRGLWKIAATLPR
ncbi:2-dehydro-3-deoxygalactonokinase [soil metagenome]